MQLLQSSLTRLLQLCQNKAQRKKVYALVAKQATDTLASKLCVFLDGVFQASQTNVFLPQVVSEYEQTVAPSISVLITAQHAEEDVHEQVKKWARSVIDTVRCKIELVQGKVQFIPSIDYVSENLTTQLSSLVMEFLRFNFEVMEFSYQDAFKGCRLIADRVLRCAD